MAMEAQTKEQLATISNDASKVIKDISKLSLKLRDAGIEGAEKVGVEVSRSLQEEINQLREAQGEFRKAVGKYGDAVHGTVTSRPYAFICGALGIGYLLGALMPPRLRRRS